MTDTMERQRFDAMWDAIQKSELPEIKTVRRKLSMHELRMLLRLVFDAKYN